MQSPYLTKEEVEILELEKMLRDHDCGPTSEDSCSCSKVITRLAEVKKVSLESCCDTFKCPHEWDEEESYEPNL